MLLSGDNHGEDPYGILEPDAHTINIDGTHNIILSLLSPGYLLFHVLSVI